MTVEGVGGRPLKFESSEELQAKIDDYFAKCDMEDRPYTVSGLAYHLDTSRETLINYEKREEFFDTIKKAKAKIHAYVEERLFGNSVTGVIFNLKNNFGWKDKTETDVTSGGEKLGGIDVSIIPKSKD